MCMKVLQTIHYTTIVGHCNNLGALVSSGSAARSLHVRLYGFFVVIIIAYERVIQKTATVVSALGLLSITHTYIHAHTYTLIHIYNVNIFM